MAMPPQNKPVSRNPQPGSYPLTETDKAMESHAKFNSHSVIPGDASTTLGLFDHSPPIFLKPINTRAGIHHLAEKALAIIKGLPLTTPVKIETVFQGRSADILKLSGRQQTVAVKFFNNDFFEEEQKWFQKQKGEVLGLKITKHPNIVETIALLVQDIKTEEYHLLKEGKASISLPDYKILACILEYVDTPDLCESIISSEIANSALAVDIGRKICDALILLHNQNIVYRDLKPDNILYKAPDSPGEEITVKLTDMGLIKQLKQEDLTSTSCGTMNYAAPEIIRGESYNHTVDAWSLGVLLFVLSAGCQLFQPKDNTQKKIKAIKSFAKKNEEDKRSYILSVEKSINPDLLNIIVELLKNDPKQRMTLTAAKEALDKLHDSKAKSSFNTKAQEPSELSEPFAALSIESS